MKFFYVIGLLTTVSAYSLIVVAVFGLCVSSSLVWIKRAIIALTIALLATSSIGAAVHLTELVNGYFSANIYERAAFQIRATGSYAWAYWWFVAASLVPQLFWFRRFRSRPLPALLISLTAVLPSTIEGAYSATR